MLFVKVVIGIGFFTERDRHGYPSRRTWAVPLNGAFETLDAREA